MKKIKEYKYAEIKYDRDRALLSWKIKSEGIPNFSLEGLKEFKQIVEDLRIFFDDSSNPIKYVVSLSEYPGVYNLGGDLPFFFESIKTQNRAALKEYAYLCIDAIYNIYTSFGLPGLSIALVEGNAYGGGFECALAHDVVLASEEAKFCLPENKFNLFPGMGAYSFLCRKLNVKKAIEFLYSDKAYNAKELLEFGLIDELITDNTEAVLEQFIAKTESKFNFIYCHYQSIKKVFPLQKEELLEITDIWVDACLNMTEKDLRRMQLIINAQHRKLRQKVKENNLKEIV